MSTTRTGPSVNWSQVGADLWNLTLDTARSRLIDVERAGDEGNVPDRTDVRTGQGRASNTAAPQVGMENGGGAAGLGMGNWVAIIAIGGLAAWLAFRD